MSRDRVAPGGKPGSDAWFVPHLYGIGATPVTWQGWALTAVFVVVTLLDVRFVPGEIAKNAILATLCVAFLVLCDRATEGGLRWRWGAGA